MLLQDVVGLRCTILLEQEFLKVVIVHLDLLILLQVAQGSKVGLIRVA
jgi:hypothetical protein